MAKNLTILTVPTAMLIMTKAGQNIGVQEKRQSHMYFTTIDHNFNIQEKTPLISPIFLMAENSDHNIDPWLCKKIRTCPGWTLIPMFFMIGMSS
jgi:hypothetical protein